MLVVVSTGIVVVDVSLPIPDGCVVVVVVVSLLTEGDVVVSEPVDFSGVSQPIAAKAKKAMKRMLFMRNTFSELMFCVYTLKKTFHH